MATTSFDASKCGFPEPALPLLPRFDVRVPWRNLRLSRWTNSLGHELQYFKRGRYALFDALKACGVGPRGAFLVPAFHCRTMLDPAVQLQAGIDLYPLREDLSPQMERVQALLRGGKGRYKALLATHYFGFTHDFGALRQLCAAHDVALIEDCSHVSPDHFFKDGLGEFGDYGFGSPYKFAPLPEGGFLWSNHGRAFLRPETQAAPLVHTAKRFYQAVRLGFTGARLPRVDARTHAGLPKPEPRGPEGIDRIKPVLELSVHYHGRDEGLRCDGWSRFLLEHADLASISRARRHNYQQWIDATRQIEGARPLYPTLPAHVTPYMFPLLLDQAEPAFGQLKRLGMPIWRWDDMADSECPVAQRYRLHLLHLPCHQDLHGDALQWMHRTLKTVLREHTTGEGQS